MSASDRGVGVTTELVERAQRGDHEAFDALASAAYHRLYAIARRILRDGYAAEDAVQDTLVCAWRDLRGLRDRDKFDAWLHRLLVHACADQVRHRRGGSPSIAVDSIDRADPSDDLAQVVDRDLIERAFLDLSVEHRAVLGGKHCKKLPPQHPCLVAYRWSELVFGSAPSPP